VPNADNSVVSLNSIESLFLIGASGKVMGESDLHYACHLMVMSVFSVESPAISLLRSKLVLDMSLSDRMSLIERSSLSTIRAIALCVISSMVDTISSSLFICFCQRSVVASCGRLLSISHTVSLLTCHSVPLSMSSMS